MQNALLTSNDFTPEEIAELEGILGNPVICVGDCDLTKPETLIALAILKDFDESWLNGVCADCGVAYPGPWPPTDGKLMPGWVVLESDIGPIETRKRWLTCPDCDDSDTEDNE